MQESDTAEFRRLQLHKLTIKYEKNCGDKQYIIANGRDLKIKFLCFFTSETIKRMRTVRKNKRLVEKGQLVPDGALELCAHLLQIGQICHGYRRRWEAPQLWSSDDESEGEGQANWRAEGFRVIAPLFIGIPAPLFVPCSSCGGNFRSRHFFVFMSRE